MFFKNLLSLLEFFTHCVSWRGAGDIGWNGLGEGLGAVILPLVNGRDPGWGTTGRIWKFCENDPDAGAGLEFAAP